MGKLICYTVITGGYDKVDETLARANPGWECWALTDGAPPPDPHGWHYRKLPKSYYSLRRQSRRPKLLSHETFPEAEFTVYMDGHVRVKPSAKLNHLVDRLGDGKLMASDHHQHRHDPYQEAAECIRLDRDDHDTIRRQVNRYRGEGLPEGCGLWEGGFLVRRACREIEEFEHVWWDEYLCNSCRDQISLPYAAWKTGLKITSLPLDERDRFYNVGDHVGRRVDG